MVRFAKDRFDAGFEACADQLLLIAEYLSEGGDRVPGYRLEPGGALSVASLGLRRDAEGRIRVLQASGLEAVFTYRDDDLVETFELRTK